MKLPTPSGLAALAVLCFALPRAEAVTTNLLVIDFQGTISKVEQFGSNPVPLPQPVFVGDPFTGTLQTWLEDGVRRVNLSFKSGQWSEKGGSSPGFLFKDGATDEIFAQAEFPHIFSWVHLINYGEGWTDGEFTVSYQESNSGGLYQRITGKVGGAAVPDSGPSASMLVATGMISVALHRRRWRNLPTE